MMYSSALMSEYIEVKGVHELLVIIFLLLNQPLVILVLLV